MRLIRLMLTMVYACWLVAGGCGSRTTDRPDSYATESLGDFSPEAPNAETSANLTTPFPELQALWWGPGKAHQFHHDRILLAKALRWEWCLNEKHQPLPFPTPISDAARLGAFVPLSSVRRATWDKFLRDPTQEEPNFSETIFISMVPFLKDNDLIYTFVPYMSDKSSYFDSYVPYCPGKTLDVSPFAFYYPTWQLNFTTKEQRNRVYNSLQDKEARDVWRQDDFASHQSDAMATIPLAATHTKASTMVYLMTGLRNQKILLAEPRNQKIILFFLDKLLQQQAVDIVVKPLGWPSSSEASRPYPYPPVPQSKPQQSKGQKVPSISFPDGLTQALEKSSKPIRDLVTIAPQCDILQDRVGKGWKIHCREMGQNIQGKTLKISITGFVAVEKTVSTENLVDIKAENLTATLHIDAERPYWFKKGKIKDTIDLAYNDLSRDSLHFRLQEANPSMCDVEVRVSLSMVLDQKPIPMVSACQDVHVYWPPAWGEPQPEVKGCALPGLQEPGHFSCLVKMDLLTTPVEGGRNNSARVPQQTSKHPPLQFSWGGGWAPVSLEASPAEQRITAEQFQPRWPFKGDDPWWDKTAAARAPRQEDPCAREPQYLLAQVTYRGTRGATLSKPYEQKGAGYLLPSMKDVGWPEDQPLPEVVQLTLRQPDGLLAQRYRPEANISWQMANMQALQSNTLREHYLEKLLHGKALLHMPEKPTIEYGNDIEMHIFADKAACITQPKGGKETFFAYYAKDEFVDRAGKPKREVDTCAVAKLIKFGAGAVSDCTSLEETTAGISVHFKPPPTQCKSDRQKLIVVSLAQGLAEIVKPAVRDTWIKVFEKVKTSASSPVFALVIIEPGRSLRTLLRCEDVRSLPSEGKESLRGRLSGIQFDGRDLRAFEDLSLVSKEFGNKGLSVLYLTDNSGVPDDTDPDTIPATWLGTPLVWRKNDVLFKIVTTKSCKPWAAAGNLPQTECVELDKDQPEKFTELLRQFVNAE